jgi:hypothetical protein
LDSRNTSELRVVTLRGQGKQVMFHWGHGGQCVLCCSSLEAVLQVLGSGPDGAD